MSEDMAAVFQTGASILSLLLMGAAGVGLLVRMVRVLAGREDVRGIEGPAAFADRRALALAFAAGIGSRLLLYLLAWGMLRMTGAGGGLFETIERLWNHWDTRHYVGIAQEGYTAVGDERLRLVFFPLYPLLMRAFSVLTGGDVFGGGLLVSLLCSGAASALVYDLGYIQGGGRTGALCVGYFLLSPMSVFLNCAYTEALFIALTLGAVCLLRRGRPWLAALCGAASALTRMPGVIIAGLLIIDLLGKIPQRRANARAVLDCVFQVLLVFSGLFLYWAINWAVTGDPFMYLVYQKENWFQAAGSFWETAATTMDYALTTVELDDWFFCWMTQLGAMFAMYGLLAFCHRRLPFDLAAYSFVYVAVVLSPTWLLSGPRYLYALCALPLLKAGVTRRGGVHAALLGASAALLALYTYGYTLARAVL